MANKKPTKVKRDEVERGPRMGRLQEDPNAVLDVDDEAKARHSEDTQMPPKTKLPGGRIVEKKRD